MVGAEDPLPVGQQRGEQFQRGAGVPGPSGPERDVVAGVESAAVVRAEHPLPVGQQGGAQLQGGAGAPGPPGPMG